MDQYVYLIVTKTLPEMVMPLSLGVLCIVIGAAVVMSKPKSGRLLILMGVVILTVFSLPIVANQLIHSLESKYPTRQVENYPNADAIVLLGGGVSPPTPATIYSQLSVSADRLLVTKRLYDAGKAPIILASGGTADTNSNVESEAAQTSLILQSWGVEVDDIVTEELSTNTRQNMQETIKLLGNASSKRILLVTSAMHMPRAMAIFNTSGLEVIPVPANRLISQSTTRIKNRWIPNAISLGGSSRALREHLGLLYFKLTN